MDSSGLGGLLFFLFHFLVFDRREVVECRVESERVVEALDVVEDGGSSFGAAAKCWRRAGPSSARRRSSRRRRCRRQRCSRSRSRCRVAAALAEEQRDVLRAVIGVMDHAGARSSSRDGHLERVDDELGAQVVAHRPADDAAREAVDDRGEVEPAGRGRDVLDVGDPELIRRRRCEVAPDQVAAGRTPGTRIVVRARFRGTAPVSRCARISRSTRLRPTRIPCCRSAAWTRRAP